MGYRGKIRVLICKVVLAAVLVVAQVAVAGHLDVDEHSVDATCVLCASSSTLSAGNVSRIGLVVRVVRTPAPAPEVFVPGLTERAVTHSARAPPAIS